LGYERTLLSAGTLGLGGHANSDEPVLGLELLHGLGRVIDKGETSGLTTTEVGAETEDGDLVLLGLVEATELLAELLLGDVGAVGVEDITAREISVSLTWSFAMHRAFMEFEALPSRCKISMSNPAAHIACPLATKAHSVSNLLVDKFANRWQAME
jgi:hypothetical protein